MIFFKFLWWLIVDCVTVFAVVEIMYLCTCVLGIIYVNLWKGGHDFEEPKEDR